MSRSPSGNRPLKIVVVGDGTIGKTCLLISYTINKFPEEHVPTVFENHSKCVNVDGIEFSLMLWDTAGQEDYEKLRLLSYARTDCFIVCYAVNNRTSFANIETKWVPELKFHGPKTAAMILLGTKSDLEGGAEFIAEKEGKKLKSKIKASHFLTCSAKTREGVDEVFIEAIRAIMKRKDKRSLCRQV